SEAHPVPLPAEPQQPLSGNFDNRLLLAGYSLDLAAIGPDGTASLGLYWRPVGEVPTSPKKIFVQLRNGQDQIIAQADHLLYDGLFYGSDWLDLQAEQSWLRDSADLRLPLPLAPEQGPYRLYIGLYDPETFERLPVIDDQSGENAVVVDLSLLLEPT
ncbi:MAG: hypothetical protein KDF65_13265, partial [Anaerolineae bacterium]|nr:hypothetical protein [Anaerolineae bacterium]